MPLRGGSCPRLTFGLSLAPNRHNMNRLFQKCLVVAVLPNAMALAQMTTAENMPQACVPFTTQPFQPPTFAHPIPEAELKKCDAAALYYGFDRPPDFAAARQCGYYQRAHSNPQ